jgi:hypothetical protein
VAPTISRAKEFLGCAFGVEFIHEGGEDLGVFLFFSFADEIVCGEKTEFEAVAGGFCSAFFGAGARSAARVSDEVVRVCDHVIYLLSGRRITLGAHKFDVCSLCIVLKMG